MRRKVEIAAGAVFVIAGLPKFLAFGWELDAFRRFGLPVPEVWVVAAGVIEIAGGILLLRGRHVVAAALALGATMAVAVVSSGILEGDVIPSLTLAPLLLAACVYLVLGGRTWRRVANVARGLVVRDVETVGSVRAAEPEFEALLGRVLAAGTDDKWWFGRAYELVGGLALLQNPEELAALCLLLRRHRPRATYLEIGSAGGGTCRFLEQEVGLGRVLSIDDGAHPRASEQEANFAAVGDVARHVGDSHAPEAEAFLAREVPRRDIDIAFVDGDHSRAGVRRDVELVLPFCRPGALLILHDTRECAGVEATWLEIVARRRVTAVAELVGSERPMGIGVARVR